MDRRNMSKGRRRRGGIFIVNVKRARRVTRLRLIPTPPPNHSRNHSTFFTSRFSLDRYKNSIASGKKRIPTVSHLSGAGRGWPISKSKGTNATRILLLFHDFFFLHFFHFFFFSRTETIASCDSSLLIFPTNFVPHISFVFVSRVNSSLR